VQHEVGGEGIGTLEPDAGTVGDEIGPPVAARVVHGRGDQLEVLGAVGVGHDEQLVTAVVEVVLHPVLAGAATSRVGAVGVVGLDQVPLARDLAAAVDGEEAVRAGPAHPEPEPLVVLAHHDLVVRADVPTRCRRISWGRHASSGTV
jgi:hypothetical protein